MILRNFRVTVFFFNNIHEEEFECTHWNLAQGAYQIYFSDKKISESNLSTTVPSFSIPKDNVKYVMCEELGT